MGAKSLLTTTFTQEILIASEMTLDLAALISCLFVRTEFKSRQPVLYPTHAPIKGNDECKVAMDGNDHRGCLM